MIWSVALAAAALGQPDASCPPDHAAMGHCTPAQPKAAPSPAARPSPPTAPAAGPADACPPDHAAMGHCTPSPPPVTPVQARPAAPALAGDPDCPPEHATMGHCTPAPPPVAPSLARPAAQAPASDPDCPPEHAAMGHCTPATSQPGVAALPPVAPPPAAALTGPEHAADTIFDPALMAAKRQSVLIDEHGAMTTGRVLIDRLELLARSGRDGYAWEGDAWFGGDYTKLWLKTEGEGDIGGSLEAAEVQALVSRAIHPFFDLQFGLRYDIRPRPDRAHLALGLQGLAPYWFEVDAAAFLSTKGDLTARVEAEYDQRVTNKLILQPRVEFDLSARDVPELGIGSGLSSAELGLRLRYQIKPEFAPYVGIGYERKFGRSARLARAEGEDVGGWSFLLGIRTWF